MNNMFDPIGSAGASPIDWLSEDIPWDGDTITMPGIYRDIPIEEYHGNVDLLDAPSISKSGLKNLLPIHGGSPKRFWKLWSYNPDHVTPKQTDALKFGKAAHALLLGDEVFEDKFAIRPEVYTDWSTKAAKKWRETMEKLGRTVITAEDFELIRAMRADAEQNEMVKAGIFQGRIERSMFWKDPETGIWIRTRPDNIPAAASIFADLKTTADFDEEFLRRQMFDSDLFIQAAMTRMVCRGLNIPFESFVLVYVLKDKDNLTDTCHVEISEEDIDRGELLVRWCLDTISGCLKSGEWPGARPFDDGTTHLNMTPWQKARIDNFLIKSGLKEGQS